MLCYETNTCVTTDNHAAYTAGVAGWQVRQMRATVVLGSHFNRYFKACVSGMMMLMLM